MDIADLRIALFSGNYNMTTDGANRALNRLVGYLVRNGAQVHVYSPTTKAPAFEPQGELVSLPSVAIPFRTEYRFSMGLSGGALRDLERFSPNIMHVSAPDVAAHRALKWARKQAIPVVASVHTRFETYARYYGLGFTEPLIEGIMRRFYQRCDALVAPSESFIDVLRQQQMNDDISLWTRGVDRDVFDPVRRDMGWRRSVGIADDDLAVGFLGRLVMEKGLDVVAATIKELERRNIGCKVLVVGDGPAREWFAKAMPAARFVGFQSGVDLGRAVASMDVLFNPSVTETFGNVTLEAMACGVPVVAAHAAGSANLVQDGASGRLVAPGDIPAFANALQAYAVDSDLRAAHGKAGLEGARAFDWDAINQTVADTYLRLIESAKGKARS
ncbi:MAG: glycosyltransferase family 4 protein [Novosphingobium sp.]